MTCFGKWVSGPFLAVASSGRYNFLQFFKGDAKESSRGECFYFGMVLSSTLVR